MCVFNDKIIPARDLNAFNLSGDAKSIHLHALRLESYLCSARFECFEPRFRANKAEISEKKILRCWSVHCFLVNGHVRCVIRVRVLAFYPSGTVCVMLNVTLTLSPGETISHTFVFDEDLNLPREQ